MFYLVILSKYLLWNEIIFLSVVVTVFVGLSIAIPVAMISIGKFLNLYIQSKF